MKKVWDVISTVFVGIVVVIAVSMMIFTIVSVNTFNRGDRDIFGFKAFIVMSDSMSKTDFDAGDLVVIKEVDPSTLESGDIITYQSQNSHNYGENVTHKIRSRTTTLDGNPGFITYGTTTDTDDEAIVTYPYVQGKYIFALPKVGTFFNFLRTPQGYFLFILIPFLMLVIHQGLNVIKAFRAYKAAQMAEIRRQRAAIAAERRRSEAMMRHLMEVQKQMQAQQAAAAAAPVAPAAPPAPIVPEAPAAPVKKHEDVDVESMMAELAALRAQLAEKNNEA
ncbi:MAG: signal peptidase I [Oscillospiraceae bacterium]|nr:signal peptidase I [Oscillospiraceae bacterium]